MPRHYGGNRGGGGGGGGLSLGDLMLLRMLRVPRYQYGGIVRRPTLAMVGEAGPEAIVPLRGRRGTSRQSYGAGGPGGIIGGLLSGSQDALGPDYLRTSLRRRAQRTSDAMRRRSAVLGGLSGLDPMQQRAAMLEAEGQANQGLAGALGEADLQGLSGYQNFIRDLLMSERRAQLEKEAEERQRGSLGGFLGQAAGSALGGWLAPGGLARGRG